MSVLMPAKSCATCKHLEIRDLALLSYLVRATCTKNIWEPKTFHGDGDYHESTTEKQACDLHEYREDLMRNIFKSLP